LVDPYGRTLARAVSRSEHLVDPEEEIRAAAIVQRGGSGERRVDAKRPAPRPERTIPYRS
jgi:hypothetical protein